MIPLRSDDENRWSSLSLRGGLVGCHGEAPDLKFVQDRQRNDGAWLAGAESERRAVGPWARGRGLAVLRA